MTLPGGASTGPAAVLSAQSPTGAVGLAIVDADFRPVAEGVGRVEATLPAPAIYEVVARAGPATARRLVKLEPGEHRVITDMHVPFPAAAPTAGTSTTHEYHMELAIEATSPGLPSGPGDGGLVVLLRDVRGHDGPPLDAEDLAAITLLDGSLRPLDGLDRLWVLRPGDAGAYWRLPLTPGPYVIRHAATGGDGSEGPDTLDQAVWVSGGWQTIVFLLRTEPGARVAWPAIQMAPLTEGWRPLDPAVGTAYELALWELRNPGGRTLLNGGAMPDRVAANPMLGIVAAAATLRPGHVDLPRAVPLVESLVTLLPDHPDVAGLRAAARLAGAAHLAPPSGVASPPMLADLYLALLRHDADSPGTLAPDSAAEVIAPGLALSGIWTTWRPIDPDALPAPPPDDAPFPETTLDRIAREPDLLRRLRLADPGDRRVVAFLASVADLQELDPGANSVASLGVRDVAAATHLPDTTARRALRRIGALLPPPGGQRTDGEDGGDGDGGGRGPNEGGGGGSSAVFPVLTGVLALGLAIAVVLGAAVALGVVRWPSGGAVPPSPTDGPTASAPGPVESRLTAPPVTTSSGTATTVPTAPTPAPILSLEVPPVYDFGETDVGTLLEGPMGIRNSGTGAVEIRTLTVANGAVDDFDVEPGTCVQAPLPPSQACEVRLRFTPLVPGRREAELLVVADAVEPPPIPLIGTGREGTLLLDPPALEYNAVSPEPVASKVTLVATDGPVGINTVTLAGRFADEYRVTFTDCQGVTVQRDGTCSVTVEYLPPAGSWTGLEQPRTAELRIESTGAEVYTVPLQARLNIID